jgi:hypothetical protein
MNNSLKETVGGAHPTFLVAFAFVFLLKAES